MSKTTDDIYKRGKAARGLSSASLRDLASAWLVFTRWCADRGYEALPATPEAVAEYLVDEVGRVTESSLYRSLRSIRHHHERAELDSPTESDYVQSVFAGLRLMGTMMLAGKDPAPREVKLDVPDDLARMVNALPDDLIGRRDRALLLVARAARLSRPQLVGLKVDDVIVKDDRVVIRVEERGQPLVIEVLRDAGDYDVGAALQAWTGAAEINAGPIFRTVHKTGAVGDTGISPQSVTVALRRAAEHAGLPASAASTDLFQKP